MRILQLIQKKQLRGAEIFAAQLSEQLVRQGHEVRIIALLDGDAQLPFSGSIEVLGAKMKKRFRDFTSWKKLARIVAEFKPDIVQANAGDTLKYAIFSRYLHKWTSPIVFRNASMVSSYAKSFVSKNLTRFLLKRTDQIIAVSSFTKEDLIRNFSVPENKCVVIPIGIDEKATAAVTAFQNDRIHLVHVGGFSFEKNHSGLLRIFNEAREKDNRLHLWMVGDGPLRKETEKQAKALGISEYCTFTGFVNNPLDYIHTADLLLLPSIIEGLPGVIIEAFYCKTPVIAYNVGGIADLIKDQQTGFLISANDEQAFTTAILNHIDLASSEKQRTIENAYQLVLREYLNPVIAQRFLEAYQQLR